MFRDEVVAEKNTEIARLRGLIWKQIDCDRFYFKRRADGLFQFDELPCWDCDFWASDHCDVDGWEPE